MSVVARCVERPQHFNRAEVQNFNVVVPFPSGACGSLGCHSVASPPRGRPWRLSPLVVRRIISMIVMMILRVLFLNANDSSCTLSYYVLVLLSVSLYRILKLLIIPCFAEIWDPTFPKRKTHSEVSLSGLLVEIVGVEPTTPCLQSRCSSQLSYTPVIQYLQELFVCGCKYGTFF